MLLFKDMGPGLELPRVETWRWMLKIDWLRDEGWGGVVGVSCMLTTSSEATLQPEAS